MAGPLEEDFVPLENFMKEGGPDFANTCFIAVVANLRHVLPPVMKFMKEHNHTWASFVTYSRTLRDKNQALKFGSGDGNGQHDATELLGAIIPADPMISGSGVQIKKRRRVFCCNEANESEEFQAMLPLVFPEEQHEYRLQELLEYYEQEEYLADLECIPCGIRTAGTFRRCIETGLNGKMVFRFGRYDAAAGRRSDRVILEPIISCKDECHYKLEAILEHSGSTVSGGHYILYLLLNGRWEKRNDAEQTFSDETGGPLRYKPSNVN